jgi:hypothetical protein
LKVSDPKRRKRLAEQVANGELTLIKLRDRVEGRRSRPARSAEATDGEAVDAPGASARQPQPESTSAEDDGWTGRARGGVRGEDALINAKQGFADALEELVETLGEAERTDISDIDRANLAKYLTIAKIRLENAIALVKTGGARA